MYKINLQDKNQSDKLIPEQTETRKRSQVELETSLQEHDFRDVYDTDEVGVNQDQANVTDDTAETEQDDHEGRGPVPQEYPLRDYVLTRDRTRRQIRAPSRFAQADLIAFALNVAIKICTS